MKLTLNTLKNKYALTLIGLIVWGLFFDENDAATQWKLHKQVKQLEEEKAYFVKEIDQIIKETAELTSNPKTLEKFGREKYLMKRDNEDIFVVVEQEKVTTPNAETEN